MLLNDLVHIIYSFTEVGQLSSSNIQIYFFIVFIDLRNVYLKNINVFLDKDIWPES